VGVPRLPHLLGIEGLAPETISGLLDLSESYIDQNRSIDKRRDVLAGRTVINLFFENSTRTRTSFEVAAKRLGADVINMDVATSSVRKGETLLDTAMTLNAMRPDAIVVRHHESGAVNLLAQKVNCAVINGGDGQHEHPTQALLDALTIRRRRARDVDRLGRQALRCELERRSRPRRVLEHHDHHGAAAQRLQLLDRLVGETPVAIAVIEDARDLRGVQIRDADEVTWAGRHAAGIPLV